MALRSYQTEIDLATLYEVKKLGGVSGLGDQIAPSIEVIGGTVDIYVSQTEPVSPPTGMAVIENGTAMVGTALFNVIPSYLYIAQSTGTTTSIVLTGIEAVEVA